MLIERQKCKIASFNRISLIFVAILVCVNSFALPPTSFNSGNFGSGDENDNHKFDIDCFPGTFVFSSVSVVGSSDPPTPSVQEITKKTSNLMQSTLKFWKTKWSNIFTQRRRQKQKASQDQEDIAKLEAVKIKSISAPNSTILTPPLLQLAGQQSRLIGNTLSTSAVQHLAKILSQHYHRMGYPLCSVTGATLSLDGECKVETDEPRLFQQPVNIAFAKEMVLDEHGNTLSFKQYKEKMESRRITKQSEVIKRADLNTTFVQTTGKTRNGAIAKAIGLKEGDVFKWDAKKWKNVQNSGIWDKVLNVEPVRLQNGSIQLRVICQESNRRRIEYGVTKSLYTGGWEGEMDFENRNLFGGGEAVSLSVKRGARDPEPSIQIRYQDDKFGLPHGYSIEAFQDYIGPEKNQGTGDESSSTIEDNNPLLTRKGITFRLSAPLPQTISQRSAISASFEQTNTRTGEQESIASSTLNLGPYVKELPSDARHSILTTLTTGNRFLQSAILRPYTAGTILARQIFPIAGKVGMNKLNPMSLALRHSITSSSAHLPRHEANALGVSSRIRGYPSDSNGPISGSLVGTTELRFPFQINKLKLGSGTFVIFADWLFARKKQDFSNSAYNILTSDAVQGNISQEPEDVRGGGFCHGEDASQPFLFRKVSIGLGLRKKFQGIPLKYDLSLTQEGKIGAFFGIGTDFDIL